VLLAEASALRLGSNKGAGGDSLMLQLNIQRIFTCSVEITKLVLSTKSVIENRIFCTHGGLSPELSHISTIAATERPTEVGDAGLLCDLLWSDPLNATVGFGDNDRGLSYTFGADVVENFLDTHDFDLISTERPTEVGDAGLLCDLLWSDPLNATVGFGDNDRGLSYTFGADVVENFLDTHDFDLICRAHQVVEDGYEFFARRKLVTVFSAPRYCQEYDNAGAVMSIDDSLMCSFQILKPEYGRMW
ncbi:hypothetical protein ADUPG1_007150, partial [Aduncisulcus paluster]